MVKMIISIVLLFATNVASEAVDLRDTVNEIGTRTKKQFYIPHYFPIQYAGNIGLVSAGVGYNTRQDKYQLSLIYGFSPTSVTGQDIHTITARNIFHLYKFPVRKRDTVIPYAALGLSFEIGGRSFFFQPDNMPDGYYDFPKSMHLIASAGIKYRHNTKSKGWQGIEFFTETCTVDAYVWYKFISDEVEPGQIFSLAFGVHLKRR